jgi:hypothetical protein
MNLGFDSDLVQRFADIFQGPFAPTPAFRLAQDVYAHDLLLSPEEGKGGNSLLLKR